MKFSQSKLALGNEILFVSIMVLKFAPPCYKFPGLGIFCVSLITAAIIDWKKKTKRVRRITRKVASCGCVKAKETISHIHMPQILQLDCTVCGAESA